MKNNATVYRILISNDKWINFVLIELQEFKRTWKSFWLIKEWTNIKGCGLATHKSDKDGLIEFCIKEWLKTYPQAEVINNSTLFTYKKQN